MKLSSLLCSVTLLALGCARSEQGTIASSAQLAAEVTAAKEASPASTEKPAVKKDLATQLTPLQFHVTQNCGTEPAFRNKYWNHKEPGIYVDVVSGEPLFASVHKYRSGSGWPAFTQPLVSSNIVDKVDRAHGMVRTEVRSKNADSHLGHVFDDGPGPNGLRYCINSAAMRFVPVADLEKEGLGQFLHLFEKDTASANVASTKPSEAE